MHRSVWGVKMLLQLVRVGLATGPRHKVSGGVDSTLRDTHQIAADA